MTLEIPTSLQMPDGTTALVRGVAAKVIDRRVEQIVYTVEKESGAWKEISMDESPAHHQLSR
jgi:hypothetical protein